MKRAWSKCQCAFGCLCLHLCLGTMCLRLALYKILSRRNSSLWAFLLFAMPFCHFFFICDANVIKILSFYFLMFTYASVYVHVLTCEQSHTHLHWHMRNFTGSHWMCKLFLHTPTHNGDNDKPTSEQQQRKTENKESSRENRRKRKRVRKNGDD